MNTIILLHSNEKAVTDLTTPPDSPSHDRICTLRKNRENGGHRDEEDVSELGPYHFHCDGFPAHLHSDGICPYTESAKNQKYLIFHGGFPPHTHLYGCPYENTETTEFEETSTSEITFTSEENDSWFIVPIFWVIAIFSIVVQFIPIKR